MECLERERETERRKRQKKKERKDTEKTNKKQVLIDDYCRVHAMRAPGNNKQAG